MSHRCKHLRVIIDNSTKASQLYYKRVRCKVCDGAGWGKNNPIISRCEKCSGTGWRLFPDGPAESCPLCLGRVKESGFVCQECDGFGEVKQL